MRKWRLFGGGGALAFWIAASLHTLSLPGYFDDAASWAKMLKKAHKHIREDVSVSALDWTLIAAGCVCFLIAVAPQRMLGRLRTAKPQSKKDRDHVVPAKKPAPVALEAKITPRGGEDVTLEFEYPHKTSCYGYGWLSGKGVSREGMFHLYWKGDHHRRKGDVTTIKVAGLSDSYSPEVIVWGTTFNGALERVHEAKLWQGEIYDLGPDDWLEIHVKIRAQGVSGSWERRYQFRLDRNQFKVKEVPLYNVGAGGGGVACAFAHWTDQDQDQV